MKSKVYFFLDLLKIRYLLPLYRHFIMANLLGFWMGSFPGVIYDIFKVHTKPKVIWVDKGSAMTLWAAVQ